MNKGLSDMYSAFVTNALYHLAQGLKTAGDNIYVLGVNSKINSGTVPLCFIYTGDAIHRKYAMGMVAMFKFEVCRSLPASEQSLFLDNCIVLDSWDESKLEHAILVRDARDKEMEADREFVKHTVQDFLIARGIMTDSMFDLVMSKLPDDLSRHHEIVSACKEIMVSTPLTAVGLEDAAAPAVNHFIVSNGIISSGRVTVDAGTYILKHLTIDSLWSGAHLASEIRRLYEQYKGEYSSIDKMPGEPDFSFDYKSFTRAYMKEKGFNDNKLYSEIISRTPDAAKTSSSTMRAAIDAVLDDYKLIDLTALPYDVEYTILGRLEAAGKNSNDEYLAVLSKITVSTASSHLALVSELNDLLGGK